MNGTAPARRRGTERCWREGRADVGEHPEVRRAARNIDVRRDRSRLARIGHFCIEKVFRAPFDLIRNSSDEPNALGCCHFAPRSCERTLGRRYSAIHILTGRLMNAPRLPTGGGVDVGERRPRARSEEHTSELQSLMRISYAVFCLKKKNKQI